MLRLILGRTGTGKTTQVFSRAMESARQRRRTILLVPEQFSFQAEKRVYTTLKGEDALSVSVLSFSRLSENIFRAWGGLARKRLTDTAKLVLMKLAVEEMKDTLKVYQRQRGRTSFLSTMLETVEELKQSGTYPQDLEALRDQERDPRLAAKLRDIAGIYGAYQALVDRGYSDPLDDIAKAAKLAEEHRYFEGAWVYIDGFSFFSPPQRQLLHAMMEQGEEVCLSLTAGGLALDDGVDIFTDQKKTAQRLVNYAREHFVKVAAPVRLTENYRTSCPALLAVEGLARGEEPEERPNGAGLFLLTARDRFEEIRFAAAQMARLVREEGWRYRDMALVCRDLEDYQAAIRSIFSAYGLPVFMDRKDQALSRPIVSLACAALDAVRGSYKTEAILKLARSPGLALPVEQAAALENYVYIWSVKGDGWLRPFRNNPKGLREEPKEVYAQALEEIEAARRLVMEPLERLRETLKNGDGESFSRGLYGFFQEVKALDNLKSYFQQDKAHGLERGRENDRLWNYMVDVLDLFADHLTGSRYTVREFSELFTMAMGCAQLGSIPVTNDQVQAGSANMVRLGSPRGVFVVGLNEGVFPARAKPYGVFTDREREALIRQGVEITSPDMERALLERFYLYSALCAPRERLYVSCAKMDLTGNAMEPGLMFSQLAERFPGCLHTMGELPPDLFITNVSTARAAYAALAAERDPIAATVGELLAELGEERFLRSLAELAEDLPMGNIAPETAKRLLGSRIALSPTKIETYYQCPYAFFSDYLLRLSPRKKAEYSPLESGTAVHYVLEMLFREVGGEGIARLADEELRDKVRTLLARHLELVAVDVEQLSARLRYQFERLVSVLFLLARHMGADFGQSAFRAVGMEVPVGENGTVHPLPIRTGDGSPVVLSGKIDRVDTFQDPSGSYARVVDYKTGNKEFHLEEVFFGLNMQMLIYLFALCDDPAGPFGEVEPAGILYMPGNVSAAKTSPEAGEEEVRREVSKGLRMSGIVLDEDRVLRAMERELEGKYIPAKKKKDETFTAGSMVQSGEDFLRLREVVYQNIREMAEELTKGKIAPLPARGGRVKDPCSYCGFGPLCNNAGGPVFRDVGTGKKGKEEEG